MEQLLSSNLKLGITAGGQLGKMLIQEASKWDITTYILDANENCPARGMASHYVKGSNTDFESVYQFGKLVDILTFEIENVNVKALKQLKAEGHKIAPAPEILELIQDKGLQKNFYKEKNIPSSPYRLYDTLEGVLKGIEAGEISYPFVQKLRKGGYDGRGVAVINDKSDLEKLLPGASLVEEKVAIDKEISVIVARNKNGEIKCFPPVEMIFDPKSNQVDKIICPSEISEKQTEEASRRAKQIIEMLNMEGLLAIEFFIDSKGLVLINEMAPRTHNSGHHSIESTVTSQFEQHLRAVLNLPLGSTELKQAAVMMNIVGDEGHEGLVKYEGILESLAIEGVKIHLYGKKLTRPFRKMGHVTILASTPEDALKKADKVKQLIKVKSWKKNQ
jgi:5-(carboxyamino)imidazole ribonucleotide synthase